MFLVIAILAAAAVIGILLWRDRANSPTIMPYGLTPTQLASVGYPQQQQQQLPYWQVSTGTAGLDPFVGPFAQYSPYNLYGVGSTSLPVDYKEIAPAKAYYYASDRIPDFLLSANEQLRLQQTRANQVAYGTNPRTGQFDWPILSNQYQEMGLNKLMPGY